MKNRAALAALVLLALAVRAAAEPGRVVALRALVAALPEKSPADDPSYLDLVAVNLPEQLAACRWDAASTATIERLIRLFDKYLTPEGGGKDALLKAIGQLPEFADRARDPQAAKNYAGLSLGIRLAPDITRARLVNEACRTLLKTHFDNGASRAALADAVEKAKAALDAAPAPN